MTYESEVLADSPLIYWRLDETSGTTAVDASGNGNDGTYIGAPILGASGLIADGTSVNFDNEDEFVNNYAKSADFSFVLTEFTMEAWVNFDDLRESWGYSVIAGFFSPPAAIDIEFYLTPFGPGVSRIVAYADGHVVIGPSIDAGTTYYLAAVYDGTDLIFYIDGDEFGRSAAAATFNTTGDPEPFTVGNDGYDGGDGVWGRVDEAAFYDHAISAARVAAHYVAGTGGAFTKTLSVTQTQTPTMAGGPGDTDIYANEVLADGPTLYWRCGDDGGDLKLHDSSGNGYDSTGVGGPTFGVTGLQTSDSDTAVHQDAGDFSFGSSHNFFPDTPLSEFTIEGIVNVGSFDPAGGHFLGFLFDVSIVFDGTGSIYGQMYDGGFGYHLTPTVQLLTGTTYHLALTYSGTSLKLYVNGALATSVTFTATGTWRLASDPSPFNSPNGLGNDIDVTIDELAYYTTALSAFRIAAHYDAMGAGGGGSQTLLLTQHQTPSLTATPGAIGELQPYQFFLGRTFGIGAVAIDRHGIEGLGVPDAKTQDVEWTHGDGVYANPDYVQMRVITIPVVIRGTPTTVMEALQQLETAFTPVSTDVPLGINLPGWGVFTVNGRPRGVKPDFELLASGAIRALCRFDCPDPTITYAA